MSDGILTLREAAKLALEELDISRNAFEAWGNSTVKIDQAFDALTAALAVPDEPVGFINAEDLALMQSGGRGGLVWATRLGADQIALYAAPHGIQGAKE